MKDIELCSGGSLSREKEFTLWTQAHQETLNLGRQAIPMVRFITENYIGPGKINFAKIPLLILTTNNFGGSIKLYDCLIWIIERFFSDGCTIYIIFMYGDTKKIHDSSAG